MLLKHNLLRFWSRFNRVLQGWCNFVERFPWKKKANWLPKAFGLVWKISSVTSKSLRFLHVWFISIIFTYEHNFYELSSLKTIGRSKHVFNVTSTKFPTNFIQNPQTGRRCESLQYKYNKPVKVDYLVSRWVFLFCIRTINVPNNLCSLI